MQGGDEKFWFHAKTYGYGWGLPASWQGWLTLIAYLGLVLAGLAIDTSPAGYVAYVGVLTILLIVIVVFTGEKPVRWRWGRKR
jgi:hypothetical protein